MSHENVIQAISLCFSFSPLSAVLLGLTILGPRKVFNSDLSLIGGLYTLQKVLKQVSIVVVVVVVDDDGTVGCCRYYYLLNA